jgi:hypothetical protein
MKYDGDTYFDVIEEWRQRYGKGHLEIRKNENKRHKYYHEVKYCIFNKILVRKAQISVESYLVY